jgi:hypothetical protein
MTKKNKFTNKIKEYLKDPKSHKLVSGLANSLKLKITEENRYQQKNVLKKVNNFPSKNDRNRYSTQIPKTESPFKSDIKDMESSSPQNIKNELQKELTSLQKANPNIIVKDIENLFSQEILNKQTLNEAERLIKERKKYYEEFLDIQKNLRLVDSRIKILTKQLTEGAISSDAFCRARDDLEQEKKELNENLWQLRSILFKEDYEKPF